MYKQESIDRIREADIHTIISNYAVLKKSGSLWECKSPFNPEERSPSFKVSTVKNNFVCYSTQQSGDGLKFVMLIDKCTFIEAVEKIASICNITLEREEETEEVKRKRSEREEHYILMEWASKQYQKSFRNLPSEHWVKQMIIDRDINEETIISFGIGYAKDDWKFLTNILLDNAKFELGKSSGLISVKDSNSYDFFKNRFMFPIHDVNGNVIGFGGRCAEDDPAKENGRKYINSKETLIYSKSKSLYGIFQAKNSIVKSRTAVLVEGYTDVTALHQNGCDMAVASGGTALTDDQCKLIKRFADQVIICRDNDGFKENGEPKAGTKAALEDIDKLLFHGLKVRVVLFPVGEDPDSYSRKIKEECASPSTKRNGNLVAYENIKDYIFDNSQDAVIWKTTFLKNQAANDPDKLSECVNKVCEMLFQIKDDVKHNAYLVECKKLLKQPVAVMKSIITDLSEKAIENFQNATGRNDRATAEDLGLPEGADFEEFKKFRFCTIENACWFQGRSGSFFKGTNYRITPLFHVYGKSDNKRLCEIINEVGSKKLIDFDSSAFVSRNKFDEALINEGFFVSTENFDSKQFTLMKNRILSDFILAFELKTLGWQKEGFFAFANCVYYNGIIKNVNNYGIVQVETDSPDESEYFEEVKHYYSPAFSEIYKHTREDDDPYENDRYFVYKISPVTLNTWMAQMKLVYKEKCIEGICSVFFALFRDLFIKTHAVSPILFLSGEKGSGKSKYAESLASLFTYKQPAFDLNASTIPAFSRRIARTKNAITILEEFNDNIHVTILQSLKGSYDNRGREIGAYSSDNRTKVGKVNSFIVMLGQYLSTWDDNSITSRSIIQHFIKPTENFTQEEIGHYDLLKKWEEQGLTSLIIEILNYRKEVEEHYIKTYTKLYSKYKKELKNFDYQERMLQNYVVIMTPLTVLWEKFTFPFSFEEMEKQFKNAILDSSDMIVESEGLAEFWRTLEYLLDRQPFALLKSGYHFKIDTPLSLKLQGRKQEKDIEWTNDGRKRILYLRLNAVHQLYHKEVSTREGVDVIGENTLRNYFKSKKYFIGSKKSERFEDTATSAYIFDYDMMENAGVVNLVRQKDDPFKKEGEPTKEENVNTNSGDQDDLPF
ncbi:DNA primase [Flavobacterium sediminilitoris]|uniref:DNA primase n=1 Tax=Flavobacterium sediminilitoris TaxID=2024526 RepID=A0ABY4HHT8_9FLAO|nr:MULTISPECIES: DNA primase [Flavobacterium]UOX32396.1 DNA primase [Flavobacterium sediminilitoris]